MKVLILGGTGMLGHKLVQRLSPRHETYATIRGPFERVRKFGFYRQDRVFENIDVLDELGMARLLTQLQPNVVINSVGVIKQRQETADVPTTLKINSIFPHFLADLGRNIGFRSIFISTDCVFLGTKGSYSEIDVPDANDLYGQSKHWGEVVSENNLTIRTSMIGRELSSKGSLIEWFLSNKGGSVKGFTNAIFNGFPTIVLADIIVNLIENGGALKGLYHISSSPISKFDLLQLVTSAMQLDITIEPDSDLKIDRSLDAKRFIKNFNWSPQSWPEMLDRFVADPTPYEQWKS